MRCAWIAALALVGACAHVTAPPAAATADEVAAALSRCVADGEACPALAKRLEARLRVRYDASTAHRLAWRMTETFARDDASLVGAARARCRAGHPSSCRALWWAVDRLFLAPDATLGRAGECPLSDAVAAAFAPQPLLVP
jgi:hypothetical protein